MSLTTFQWGVLIAGVIISVYAIARVAASGWADGFFARKARYNKELLEDLERSSSNGNDRKDPPRER